MSSRRTSKDGWVIFLGLTLVISIGTWSFFRSGRDETSSSATDTASQNTVIDFQKISVSDLKNIVLGKIVDKETIVLDMRPASLWSEEHIIGSKSLSYDEANESLQPTDTEKKRQWIIVAPDTSNAGQFVTLLRSRGVSDGNIRVLDGTYETWKEQTGLIVHMADPSSPIDVTKVTLASPEDAKMKIEENGRWFILDIRSANLFEKEHITGAINIPFSEIEEKRAMIPSTTSILVYGNDDRESFAGGVLLFDLGFFNTITLSAGFDDWKAKNLPISK